MSQPIVELMGLVNQLFSVSYITEPVMLYQLVSIALATPVDQLFDKGQLMRTELKDIEKLTDIFFREDFNFMRFVKSDSLSDLELDHALDYIQGYYQKPTESKPSKVHNERI